MFEDFLKCADHMLFDVGWSPQVVENMTYDDMVHYVNRYVAWVKRQPKRRQCRR